MMFCNVIKATIRSGLPIAVALVALGGCGKSKPSSEPVTPGAFLTDDGYYEILLEWDNPPRVGVNNNATIFVAPRGGASLPLTSLEVMPTNGNGRGKFAPSIEPLNDSADQFHVKNVHFISAGNWVLNIELASEYDKDKIAIPVTVAEK